MTVTAGSPSASVPSPERLAVPRTGPDRGTVPPAIARSRPGRELVRTAVSVAIVAVIFGFALPRFASYGTVLFSMSTMTWPPALPPGGRLTGPEPASRLSPLPAGGDRIR